MKRFIWILWSLITLGLIGWVGYGIGVSEDKSTFLIGEASHGHFQIEMACSTCHTEAFGGTEVLQDACTSCHAEELEAAHDSHPRKKFTDPREAYRLEIIDARYCISCHVEHQEEQTREMGVTLPDDYCYHCHQEVGDERESHKDLPFDSCATAGCHNFHDNRALYESFLVQNAGGEWLSENPHLPQRSQAALLTKIKDLTRGDLYAGQQAKHPDIAASWSETSHGAAGMTCGGCHTGETGEWLAKPAVAECQTCHQDEAEGYLASRHGMRLNPSLEPALGAMTPGEGRLNFHGDMSSAEQGCNSCHKAHEFDTGFAAVEACLGCHSDDHSASFMASPHGQLWQQASAGDIPAQQSVTCATCHLPRMERTLNGEKVIGIQHNQNDNLRPNEKMIRPVCMQCHNLEFSIDALADPALIENNFNGKPSVHIESIDWALKRVKE